MSSLRIIGWGQIASAAIRAPIKFFLSLLVCNLLLCATHVGPAEAGKKNNGSSSYNDDWKQQRQREIQEQKEQARRAAELQKQQERKAQLQTSKSEQQDKNNNSSNNKDSGTSSASNKKDGKKQSDQSRDTIDDDDGPPPTVAKWWKKLTEPEIKPVEKIVDRTDKQNQIDAAKRLLEKASPGQLVPANSPAKPANAKPSPAKLSAGGRPEPIAFPEVPLPEVLAVNATVAQVARAQSLGFKAAPATSLASLNISVTRLLAPQGMTTADAQALLREQFPGNNFAPNMKYRIYKTASGTETKPAGVPPTPSAPQIQSCGDDRCFAQDIIGWKPALGKCASGLKIGIIDTSIDTSHPAFKRKHIEVRHLGPKNRPGPDWHGTGVTALLAGDDKSATPGLIPDASFYVADIFYAGEDKGPASDTLSMLRAFDWLESNDVKIINMSLSGPPDALIEDAVAKLSAKGILLVAAAGNDGPNNVGPSYPAAYDDVIAVTAVNKKMQNYRYANRGAYVDIAAPGVAIWTALPGSQQAYHSGTSFATPYVTASLAAIYTRIGGRNSKAALQALNIRDLGDAGSDPVYGRGLLVAPASCTGGLIATAPEPQPSAPVAEPTGLFGLFTPSSTSAASTPKQGPDHGEELPWLSLDDAR